MDFALAGHEPFLDFWALFLLRLSYAFPCCWPLGLWVGECLKGPIHSSTHVGQSVGDSPSRQTLLVLEIIYLLTISKERFIVSIVHTTTVCFTETNENIGIEEMVDEFLTFYIAGRHYTLGAGLVFRL